MDMSLDHDQSLGHNEEDSVGASQATATMGGKGHQTTGYYGVQERVSHVRV